MEGSNKNNIDTEEFIDSVKEVELKIKDHRADDEFEKMLAELNGKKEPAEPAPAPAAEKPADRPAAPEAVAAMSSAVAAAPAGIPAAMPKRPPQQGAQRRPAQKKKRPPQQGRPAQPPQQQTAANKPRPQKKRPPQPPQKSPEEIERDRKAIELRDKAVRAVEEKKEAAERAERERKLAEERARREKEREEQLINKISDIWDSPEFSDGGRVKMNIKTEERKEIHITIPPKVREKAQAERDAILAEEAKRDLAKRTAEQHAAEKAEADALAAAEAAAKAHAAKMAKTAEMETPAAPIAAAGKHVQPTAELPKQPAGAAASQARQRTQKTNRPAEAEGRKQAAASTGSKGAKSEEKKISKAKARRIAKAEKVRKQFGVANVIVCCAIFFGIGTFLLVCERRSGFISSENRNLAEKPELTVQSLIDGSYFTEISKWYTDTIPGREELKPVSNKFTKLFGITFNDVKITGDITPVKKETLDTAKPVTTTTVTLNTDFNKPKETTTSRKPRTQTETLAEVPEELDDGEWIGNVIVAGKGKNVRALSAFYGMFETGEKYAETINKYRDDLGDSINIYTMNMPNSSAYYMPDNLADEFTSQHDCIINIGNNLRGIMNIDVYDELDKHSGEYIYSRTDHHWTPLGAYYAAKVFSEKASFSFPDLKTYDEYKIEGFVGTMYAYSDYDEELNRNPDTFIYYKPDNNDDLTVNYYATDFTDPYRNSTLFFDQVEGVSCYSAILGTDETIAEIETGVKNGRVLVIIKDSFGNALVPYFTHGFERIYVVDFRYFDINAVDFCYDVGATDLLFAVSLAAAHTESHIDTIGNIRIQEGTIDTSLLPEDAMPATVIPDEDDNSSSDDDAGAAALPEAVIPENSGNGTEEQ